MSSTSSIDDDNMREEKKEDKGGLVHLWRGADKVELGFEDELDGDVAKVVDVEDRVFLMTKAGSLYYGDLIEVKVDVEGGDVATAEPSLKLEKSHLSVVDVAVNSEYVFVVIEDGSVQKINPKDLSVVDAVFLKEDVKYCSHGCKQNSCVAKVTSIAVNDSSALFVTETGQLWASGDQPQIDIKCDINEPKRVIFFEGRFVSQVACGSNFYVVLVRRLSRLEDDDSDSENQADEVFVESCPRCVSRNAIPNSPVMSVASCDTGLMNVNPQHFGDERSASANSASAISSASKEEDVFQSEDKSGDDENSTRLDTGIGNGELIIEESAKKNSSLLINTEAARQFLTRQLSWVSYGSPQKDPQKEELPLNAIDSNPASLIKQNVSSMASMVYEGVKTVGDKVVTLSRHVSGSSDPSNEARDNGSANSNDDDNFEELGIEESKRTAGSLINSLKSNGNNNNNNAEDGCCPWSSSAGSSEHELAQKRLNERVRTLVRTGSGLLSSELWTWGDVKYGQLGVGDIINRPRPREVTALSHCAVKNIACGDFHTLAFTLDGRVFGWGRNNFMQVAHCSQLDQKSPQLFSSNYFIQLGPNERARDVAAGSNHSLIMTDRKVFLMGKYKSSGTMSSLNVPEVKGHALKSVFCASTLSCCAMTKETIDEAFESLTEEQIFLEETIYAYRNVIRPFQVKGGATRESDVYEALCCCYRELLSINVINVRSLWDFYSGSIEAPDVTIVANADEFISVYKSYLNAVCDTLAIGGFAQIAKLVDALEVLLNVFKDKINGKDDGNDVTNEAVVAFVLQYPLQHLSGYLSTIKNLIKLNRIKTKMDDMQDALSKWDLISKEQAKRLQDAKSTKNFWEGSGKLVEQFKSPDRRMIRESRTHPISLHNSGRFSSHWFILLTDVLMHVSGTNYTAHLLPLLWVELLPDSDTLKNAISITTPEDSFVLYTPTAADRSEWFHALQTAIKNSLQRSASHMPPQNRTGSFSFTKHPVYKDAIYTGQWTNGKLHGSGKLEWADNRMYIGQFHKGAIHGTGRMEMPTQGVYEGQWKDGQQNGYGIMNYINGDVYEGYFKDGLPHGHGMKKEGHFTASIASVYIGEWSLGMKQGYGVMDDIMTGEKYMGTWNNNAKHGSGCLVTLDGIYYEGAFVQDVFTGHGIMVLEDGTHYEGEFKSVGVFGGKGILTFSNEEKLEGNFSGAWNEGIKVTATLHINKKSSRESNKEPQSFCKLYAPPDQKWKAIFRQFYQQLGVSENSSSNGSGSSKNSSSRQLDTQKLWHNVAAIISKSQRSNQKRQYFNNNTFLVSSFCQKDKDIETNYDQLNKILCYEKLSIPAYEQIHKYLSRAFESPHHPLGTLLNELATVYTATYGGVRVHPLLLKHAVSELTSITTRIYEAVTLFFPALPKAVDDQFLLKSDNDDRNEEKVISAAAILHPILLPRVYSALFVLYALHNKKNDDAYWERLIKWNKQPNSTLLAFLEVNPNIWKDFDASENDTFLNEAIETLQQLKTTFSAVEKLLVLRNTHHEIELAIQKRKENNNFAADDLIPIFYFVVIRASVLQLGSELNFMKDFMEPYLINGVYGYAYSTVEGIYDHILQEKISMDKF